jgi:putative modified peptide
MATMPSKSGGTMANPTIGKREMLHLLEKLSSDDGFRSRFEKDPKAGLLEAGIGAAQVAAFPADQLTPGKLANKSVFAADHELVVNDLAEECLCMVIPQPQFGPPRKR